MPSTLTTQNSIAIHAPAANVWAALTTPALIKKWFFGVETETDWKVGSPLVHTGDWQGKPYVDKGYIVKIEPQKVLEHSHWSALSGLPDSSENYQTVTYTLAERDGATDLTITEVNLPSEAAKALSEQSWKLILNSLKQLLES